MTYRNIKTGVVIRTTGKVSGKNWAPVDDNQKQAPVDDASEESTAEKAPAKTSRKGKKQ